MILVFEPRIMRFMNDLKEADLENKRSDYLDKQLKFLEDLEDGNVWQRTRFYWEKFKVARCLNLLTGAVCSLFSAVAGGYIRHLAGW